VEQADARVRGVTVLHVRVTACVCVCVYVFKTTSSMCSTHASLLRERHLIRLLVGVYSMRRVLVLVSGVVRSRACSRERSGAHEDKDAESWEGTCSCERSGFMRGPRRKRAYARIATHLAPN
jgi:hypothetical protein